MDERLPLGSLNAATLAMLLEKERTHRAELEAEVARLRAGIARQNAVITRLEEQNRALRREQEELRTLVAGLTEQNRLLRQQVAHLEQENAQLRGMPLAPAPAPAPASKPATPQRESTVRRKWSCLGSVEGLRLGHRAA